MHHYAQHFVPNGYTLTLGMILYSVYANRQIPLNSSSSIPIKCDDISVIIMVQKLSIHLQ